MQSGRLPLPLDSRQCAAEWIGLLAGQSTLDDDLLRRRGSAVVSRVERFPRHSRRPLEIDPGKEALFNFREIVDVLQFVGRNRPLWISDSGNDRMVKYRLTMK